MTTVRTRRTNEEIYPGDDGYGDAARVFVGAGRPAMVVRPSDPAGVGYALERAAHQGLALSVRSGGHSPLGHGTNTGGMVIDLAHLNDIDVLDVGRRLVRVGAGASWAQVGAALDRHGWALTAGDTAGVGVGGLTLAGGFGWMVRRYGLAIDNLVGARVVTADGRLITASADAHPDLFWALRGGGGNFGVAVDFDFIAQPVGPVYFGSVGFRTEDPTRLLARWRDVMRTMPEEVTSTFVLTPATPAAMVLLCYTGGPDTVTVIDPLLRIGTTVGTHLRWCRYAEILEDGPHPTGVRMVLRNTLVPDLDESAIGSIARLSDAGSMAVAVRSLGGVFGRVSPYSTAFAHRDAEAMVVGAAMLPDSASDTDVARALAPWPAVAAHGTGSYLGLHGSATPTDLQAAYPPATYQRLARAKRVYDPTNLFNSNHNVEPASGTTASATGAGR